MSNTCYSILEILLFYYFLQIVLSVIHSMGKSKWDEKAAAAITQSDSVAHAALGQVYIFRAVDKCPLDIYCLPTLHPFAT